MFTGRFIPAPEAQALGLVNRIVPTETIEADVMTLAREIAAQAPLTIRATKEMTRRLLAARRPTESDADLIEMCYMSADFGKASRRSWRSGSRSGRDVSRRRFYERPFRVHEGASTAPSSSRPSEPTNGRCQLPVRSTT